jgi:ribosomal protein S18 acetylase RimI-like enzyme
MYTKVLLKVHEDNMAAYRLYNKIGFMSKQKINNRYEMEAML